MSSESGGGVGVKGVQDLRQRRLSSLPLHRYRGDTPGPFFDKRVDDQCRHGTLFLVDNTRRPYTRSLGSSVLYPPPTIGK